MKTLLISILAALTFVSCNDEEPGGNNVATGDGCFASFKVDGESYLVENMALCTFLDSTLLLAQSIGTGDFQLQIYPIASTGAYAADPTDPSVEAVIFLELNDGTRIAISSGTINVSTLNGNKVSGTFSGNFFDVMDINQTPDFVVSDGVFEADL